MKSRRWTRLAAGILFGCAAFFASGGGAFALGVGDKAPNFTLASSTGSEIKLADYTGKQNLVLFFYIAFQGP